jgi:hypothetical protein
MVTRELVKSEIDKLQDRYLETLYRIIKAFDYIPASKKNVAKTEIGQNEDEETREWLSFIESTYGCLSDDPIERGGQGEFEIREVIH